MKELDVVRLKSNFQGLTAGTEGAIVLEYDGTAFEVEFFDKGGGCHRCYNNTHGYYRIGIQEKININALFARLTAEGVAPFAVFALSK